VESLLAWSQVLRETEADYHLPSLRSFFCSRFLEEQAGSLLRDNTGLFLRLWITIPSVAGETLGTEEHFTK
jgi:hypothetical protein